MNSFLYSYGLFRKFLIMVIAIIICNTCHSQRQAYIIDSIKVDGTIVVDEINNKIWFCQDPLKKVETTMSYKKFRNYLSINAYQILEPFDFNKIIETDTLIQKNEIIKRYMERKNDFVRNLHRKNTVGSTVLFSKGDKICYKRNLTALYALIVIKSGVLPGIDVGCRNNKYLTCFALLKLDDTY